MTLRELILEAAQAPQDLRPSAEVEPTGIGVEVWHLGPEVTYFCLIYRVRWDPVHPSVRVTATVRFVHFANNKRFALFSAQGTEVHKTFIPLGRVERVIEEDDLLDELWARFTSFASPRSTR